MYKNANNSGPLMLHSAPSPFSSSIGYPSIWGLQGCFWNYASAKFLAISWERTHYNLDILENQVKANKQQ